MFCGRCASWNHLGLTSRRAAQHFASLLNEVLMNRWRRAAWPAGEEASHAAQSFQGIAFVSPAGCLWLWGSAVVTLEKKREHQPCGCGALQHQACQGLALLMSPVGHPYRLLSSHTIISKGETWYFKKTILFPNYQNQQESLWRLGWSSWLGMKTSVDQKSGLFWLPDLPVCVCGVGKGRGGSKV